MSPRFSASWVLLIATLGCAALCPARAAFAADVRTSTSATVPNFANRLYLDSQRTLAPAGTRIWFVVDRNGDGVPANPEPGAILGADDQLALEDVVPGSLPATFPGRFNRSGFSLPDDSLRGLTNVFVYLWQFSQPLAEVPHYEPPAGARFGLERVAATPQPDVGNATWRVVVDVFADARTLGGTGPAAPQITGQPAGLTVNAGQPAALTVTATGTAPLSYEWRRDGTAIPGATAGTFTLAAAEAGDAGAYTVVVSNAQGSATSDPAVLVVLLPPTVTAQPQSQTVPPGQSVTFTVVATGTTPFAYQWRKDGVDLAGATESTLVVASVQTADQGRYAVKVTNAAGEALSAEALLTVDSSPSGVRIEGATVFEEGGKRWFSFSFATQTGVAYQVQASTEVAGPNAAWANTGGVITGTGQPVTFSEPLGEANKFHRVWLP